VLSLSVPSLPPKRTAVLLITGIIKNISLYSSRSEVGPRTNPNHSQSTAWR